MKFFKKFIIIFNSLLLFSCANYEVNKSTSFDERKYYNSKGFALIYEDELYEQKVVNRKINNDQLSLLHDTLKRNTIVEITNPVTSISIEAKVINKAKYPDIFNIVISEKIAKLLKLNRDNPFVEINEVKKNKTFIAKKANTYDEEKNVAEKAPIDEVKIDDLTKEKKNRNK